MISNLESSVAAHMADVKFMQVIDAGTEWLIFTREKICHFRIGSSLMHDYQTLMATEDMLDLVCGTLDVKEIRYRIFSARDAKGRSYVIEKKD